MLNHFQGKMSRIIITWLLVVHLFLALPVQSDITCPEGIKTFSSDVQGTSYYACDEEKEKPVLKTCAPGSFYWAYRESCDSIEVAARSGNRTDLVIFSRPALGATVFLGDLYDVNTNKIFTGYSLWKRSTILNNKIESISPSESSEPFHATSKLDRLQNAGFSPAMKMNILGDLIPVAGSSAYLKETLESTNEIAVILPYQATTKEHTLPVSTSIDFDVCAKAAHATHVITSITVGIGANFVFRRTVHDNEDKDEVSRDLKRAVDAIKTTKTNISDPIKKLVKDVRVNFFADFISEKVPGTYADSVYMYQSLARRVGKYPNYANNTVPIKLKLMPITKFCKDVKTNHIAISENILDGISKMLNEMEETQLKINTLKMTDIVRDYLPLMKILQALSDGLTRYQGRMKTELQLTLPRVRTGDSTEAELIRLLDMYESSSFNFDKIEMFLRNRGREINALNDIVHSKSLDGSGVTILDYQEASDTTIMLTKPYVLKLQFNILPSKILGSKFLSGKEVDESKAWYNVPQLVSAMGIQFANFIQFSSCNTNSKLHGYILAITDAKDNVINVDAQEKGLLYNFTFPEIPPKVALVSNTHDSMTFTVKRPTNIWVKGFSISYWHYGKKAKVSSKEFDFSDNNITTFKVDNLMANNLYEFSMQYLTTMGSSAPSPPAAFHTRPCSVPTELRTSSLSADHFEMLWDPPLTCGEDAVIQKYRITVSGANNLSTTILVNGNRSVEVNRLQSASEYHVSLEGITNKQTFNGTRTPVTLVTLPSSFKVLTRPEAPSGLSLVNRSIHSAIVKWTPPTKLATGAVIEKYLVKYVKANDLGSISVNGTEMVLSCSNTTYYFTNLVQGTTYLISVKVLTSKQDSDYSPNLIIRTLFKLSELEVLSTAISNIPTLMVYYPRISSNEHQTDSASGCGGIINTDGELRYPSYTGDAYHYHEDCTWNINTGSAATLQFTYWGLSCNPYHYVMIHDEELMLLKTGSNPGSGPIQTHSGNVYVRFHTDTNCGKYSGFRMTISVQNTLRMAAQRYYLQYRATFTGYGAPSSCTQRHTWMLPKRNDSIPLCIKDCNGRYMNDHSWNQVSIELKDDPLVCTCYKNAHGFDYSLSKFHFRIV